MNLLSKYRVSILAAFLAVAFLVPAAHAQVGETIAQFQVPFAFECGSRYYPAGLYNIRRWGTNTLMISGLSRSGFATARTDANVRATETGKAVFRVVGNQHFLHEIRGMGTATAFIFYASRAEQEIGVASNSMHQPDIQLALSDDPH